MQENGRMGKEVEVRAGSRSKVARYLLGEVAEKATIAGEATSIVDQFMVPTLQPGPAEGDHVQQQSGTRPRSTRPVRQHGKDEDLLQRTIGPQGQNRTGSDLDG